MKKVLQIFCILLVLTLGLEDAWSSPLPEPEIVIPAMARKAGGTLRQELLQKPVDKPDSSPTSSNEEEYDYGAWSNEGSSEEPDCPGNHFYHIRGRQCVPLRCSHGRNQMTEQCHAKPHFRGSYSSGRGGGSGGGGGSIFRSNSGGFSMAMMRGGKKG